MANPILNQYITDYLTQVAGMLGAVSAFDIAQATSILCRARQLKSNVWLVGNGGSAATAAHFANDLLKMGRVNASAIPNDVPAITAFGNDEGWEDMFSNVLETVFDPADVLIAISCSGKSPNVVRAAQASLRLDGYLIVLTGPKTQENVLAALPASALVSVNHADIKVVEDCHLAVCHSIAGMLANGKAKND